ncbi:OmpA family protein [Hydrogenimonas urashimensis]|uniref:OmpA family protein n=1 Tax=Hydrogenimonas urashimensis TaxID=2740515 RepID=UPI0019161EB5|nr:OmpA family protein [Hydrogenimonas urashimensis]
MTKRLGMVLLSIAAASSMMAQDYTNSVTVTGGGYSPLNKEWIDDAWTLGARLGLIEGDTHGLEVEYDFINNVDLDKNEGTGDTYGNQVFANYLYHFKDQSESLRPYLLAGVGYENWTNGQLDDGGVGAIGAGLKYAVNEWLNLRAEVKDVIRFDDGGNTLAYVAGFMIPFGTPAAAAPVAAAAPLTSLDSDGDGVIDTKDKCPHTPAGTIVDENGCPDTKDSDGDGVIDVLDNCPNSKTNQVDENGCPLDTDKDGVPDYIDQCPNTPPNFHVDAKGCTIGVTLHLNFPFDSAKIPAQETMDVDRIAEFLKKHPKVTAVIEGHTDSTGPADYNMKLSKRRAEAVKKALVERGIDASRLTVKAYGETKPIAPNDTEEGRAKNRRVEVVLVPGKGQ